jgi:hypothetical protein
MDSITVSIISIVSTVFFLILTIVTAVVRYLHLKNRYEKKRLEFIMKQHDEIETDTESKIDDVY